MIRLTRHFLKRHAPASYICPRCGHDVERLTPSDEVRVHEHRLLHLSKEWSESLESSTGWIIDDDGGLRPVAD